MNERFVVCGLAPPRSEWFRRVAQWAMTGAVPVEFHKCQSAEELQVRLDAPRPVSAVLIDAAASGLDRDLLRGGARRTPVLVVTHAGARADRDWTSLGAAGQLDHGFDAPGLIDSLAAVATPIARVADVPGDVGHPPSSRPATHAGVLLVVTGTGGTGASTVAAALAQGAAFGKRRTRGGRTLTRPVVLADLALRADQAMLHDVDDPLVTVQELVDACRTSAPNADMVRRHCASVEARGYHLLLGLRRERAWAALRPRAVVTAVDGLRMAYGTVVADVTGDFEGEAETGSIDVEERNALARAAVARAACVLAVSSPGMAGIHGLVRLVHALAGVGVTPARIMPVVNRAPRSARMRAGVTAAIARLCELADGRPCPPLFLPERRVDDAFRDGAALPSPLPSLLAEAAEAVITRAPVIPEPEQIDTLAPRLVEPGSIGALRADGGELDVEDGSW